MPTNVVLYLVGLNDQFQQATNDNPIPTIVNTGSFNDLLDKPTIARQERYTGTTNGSGIYAVTYATAYATRPNVQVNLISGTNKESWVVASTSTGFTILVQARADVVGLLPTYSNVTSRIVDVLVTAV